MSLRPNYHRRQVPDFIELDGDEAQCDRSGQSFASEGTTYHPATDLEVGSAANGPKAGFAQVMLRHGSIGLFVGLSPDAARTTAAALLQAADAADRTLGQQAAAAIQKAQRR